MASYSTDTRILTILAAGRGFLSCLDPEGLLSCCRVKALDFTFGEDCSSWNLDVVFPSGLEALVGGDACGGAFVICSLAVRDGKGVQRVPVSVAGTVAAAVGDVSLLPLPLKRSLPPLPGVVLAKQAAFDLPAVFSSVREALFYGVEGGGRDEGLRSRFVTFSVRYEDTQEQGPVGATLSTRVHFCDGSISVCSDMDVYGLSNRSVSLCYNLGMGHRCVTDCLLVRDGRSVPSLRLAFDLASKFDGLYSKQRKKKTGLGKPRSSRQ